MRTGFQTAGVVWKRHWGKQTNKWKEQYPSWVMAAVGVVDQGRLWHPREELDFFFCKYNKETTERVGDGEDIMWSEFSK